MKTRQEYRSRPAGKIARKAWDAFTIAAEKEPTGMRFGWAQHYGQIWTADIGECVWGWSFGWGCAPRALATPPQTAAIGW